MRSLPPHNAVALTGHEYFPQLIAGPFHHGLVVVFTPATVMSWLPRLPPPSTARYLHADLPAQKNAHAAGPLAAR